MTLLFMNYFTRKALKINHDKTRKQFHMGNRGLSLKRDQPYRTLRIWAVKKGKKKKRTCVQDWMAPSQSCLHLPLLPSMGQDMQALCQLSASNAGWPWWGPKTPQTSWTYLAGRRSGWISTQLLPLVIPHWRQLGFKWSHKLQTVNVRERWVNRNHFNKT